MSLSELRARLESEYRERTSKSRRLFQEGCQFLPGADTRFGTCFPPYPTYIDYGKGRYLYDVDGNEILDFTNNATTLIHGHAHPEITEAIQGQRLGAPVGQHLISTRYNWHGFDYLLRQFVPLLKEEGLNDDQIQTILIENPRAVLDF